MLRKALITLTVALMLGACSMTGSPASAEDYALRAEALIKEDRYAEAVELLREAIYRHPSDYELNLNMGKALMKTSRKFIPGDRGLFLARHYLRRAESLAPNTGAARAAHDEYAYALELQRSTGWK